MRYDVLTAEWCRCAAPKQWNRRLWLPATTYQSRNKQTGPALVRGRSAIQYVLPAVDSAPPAIPAATARPETRSGAAS